MACEHCSPNDSECGVCRDWDRRRAYSRAVSWWCMTGLVMIFAVAVTCGVVNLLWPKH